MKTNRWLLAMTSVITSTMLSSTGLAGDAGNDYYSSLEQQAHNIRQGQAFDAEANPYANMESQLKKMQTTLPGFEQQLQETTAAAQKAAEQAKDAKPAAIEPEPQVNQQTN